jgi:hypothetical protein
LDTHGNFDRCDEARAKTSTAAITVFLVGCAIPFTIVESSFFIKMIETLNLGYLCHLPKDDAFCRTHLLTLFNDTIREINELWQVCGNPLLTMGFDGYTGENSNSVVNITETAEDLAAFKNCVDPGENSEDGIFLANYSPDI